MSEELAKHVMTALAQMPDIPEMPCYDYDGNRITFGEMLGIRMLGDGLHRHLVASTVIGAVHISTVWLGLDHGLGRTKPPQIFETMVFGAKYPTRRYSTADEAYEGHLEIEAQVRRDRAA